ncbi:MAG: formate dehydrogenase family accessory protein FdhD [Candidatus Solincola sediminis]|uniref:Sulfur carrier protein FdhD n=1 Tax=Candidatus Solincola sediminis TaxID=1797199 RepID=A0A1F2WM89_9ACTN|nr:MAG: formate dehydrogenase family accessory protein FdhD [Candidatus Solincola sediminis]OFW61405.1 MAG: formate dehydrogenase family accessory protein FdhD [Candidatus Solincola sediminis]
MSTVDWNIKRFRSGRGSEELRDRVVIELPLEIKLNGIPLVALMRMPGMDKELAVGFCLTEKIIDDISQIRLLKHCGQLEQEIAGGGEAGSDGLDRGNVVEIEAEAPADQDRFSGTFIVRTGCGGADLSALEDYHEGTVSSRLEIGADIIYGVGRELTRHQEVFAGTGGTHGAGVFERDGRAAVVAEDVGRHNALDKAVGWCALWGTEIRDKFLVLSGRISYEMALKAVRVGIPVVVSMAAPTSLGLRIAEKAGLTLVGFSDGKRFNVYTHPERIV